MFTQDLLEHWEAKPSHQYVNWNTTSYVAEMQQNKHPTLNLMYLIVLCYKMTLTAPYFLFF